MTSAASGVWLRPLDTLFFRDGRPFQATSRVQSGLPNPQTMAGALRTALLSATEFDFHKFSVRRRQLTAASSDGLPGLLRDCGASEDHINATFRGPWLALKKTTGPATRIEPLLPVPQSVVADESNQESLVTVQNWRTALPRSTVESPLPGWNQKLTSLWPLWRDDMQADAERPGGWLTLAGIRQFLKAIAGGEQQLESLELEYIDRGRICGTDSRVGIAVNAETLTAVDGMLYGIDLLSLPHVLPPRATRMRGSSRTATGATASVQDAVPDPYANWEVGLYAEIEASPGIVDLLRSQLIPLGGEGRHVQLEVVATRPGWPALVEAKRSVLYLATPGIFVSAGHSSWLPDGLRGAEILLRGAASDRAVAVSGWDIARNGAKPTRFAVPAGAVYFVEGQPTLNHSSLCADLEDVAQGWGFALQGDWK